MKKLILFVLLVACAGAADAPKVPATPPAVVQPTPEQREIAELKEQVAALQKAVAILKQQRDALAAQLLDVQVAQQMQEGKK